MRDSFGGRAALAAALLCLSVVTGAVPAAAACHSSCRQQLVECKQTCAGSGQTRRDCRAVCAARSTCTASGARIRTLAYVVTECRQDPQGLSSSRQTLLVRRGNCDPVTVKAFVGGPPRPDPLGLCRLFGESRAISRGFSAAQIGGLFQRLAVLPDGSGVVFEVTKQHSVQPSLTPEAPEEGIFFVRANGRGLRPLGPASRRPPFLVFHDPTSLLDGLVLFAQDSFPVSPDGRQIALIDLGPFDAVGHEAPQIFLLDLRSGRRRQLTHQSHVTGFFDPHGICCEQFLNSRAVTYHTPIDGREFRVKTNGKSPERGVPPPILVEGARVVPQFTVTGARPQLLFVRFPDRRAVNGGPGVTEVFLLDGKNLLQLTNFGRSDTFLSGGFIARGWVFFPASANPPPGRNPAGICSSSPSTRWVRICASSPTSRPTAGQSTAISEVM